MRTALIGAAVALLIVAGTAAEDADTIKNPFYEHPVWRLWTEDPSPVPFLGRHKTKDGKMESKREVYAVPAAKDRLYPDFSQPRRGPSGLPVLKHFPEQPEVAGFWDDCYMTMDGAHTRIPTNWSDGSGASVSLQDQFIRVGFGYAFQPQPRMDLGANFTSQSFARRGRHIVDDFRSNREIEAHFFFANCVRATPAHVSYKDNDPEKVHDDYDALFGHAYQSVGQSGSETQALFKMLLAGGCMPRETKNLLKRHGAYATALLTIFKAALPYCDAHGEELPFENELRHRPAYSSIGGVKHPHYCSANPHYHGYDEALHVRRMIDLAREMDAAPPVTVLALDGLSAQKNGETLLRNVPTDERVQSANKTLIRIWGRAGETVTAYVDATDSYDLQGLPLEYECRTVYPNQKNVSIMGMGKPGMFEITVTHDPDLPKGRIPVLIVARNGRGLPGNPTFVNFYWPQENERSNWLHYNSRSLPEEERKKFEQTKIYPVTDNLRPVPQMGLADDTVQARPGDTVRFPVRADDPEGYPVTAYRRPGEVGRIAGGEFSFTVPEDDPGRVHPVHLTYSDGTGGYTGRLIKILVTDAPYALPAGWSATTLGLPRRAGKIQHAGGEFEIVAAGGNFHRGRSEGLMAYRRIEGDFDVVCRLDELSVEGSDSGTARLALVARKGLEDFAPCTYVCAYDESVEGNDRRAEFGLDGSPSPWGGSRFEADEELATPVRFLRLARHGDQICGYVSADREEWEAVGWGGMKAEGKLLVGLAVASGDSGRGEPVPVAHARCEWLEPGETPLPGIAVQHKGKRERSGAYKAPIKVTLTAPGDDVEIRYTLDGTEPGTESDLYAEEIALEEPGRLAPRARLYREGEAGPIAVFPIEIEK